VDLLYNQLGYGVFIGLYAQAWRLCSSKGTGDETGTINRCRKLSDPVHGDGDNGLRAYDMLVTHGGTQMGFD